MNYQPNRKEKKNCWIVFIEKHLKINVTPKVPKIVYKIIKRNVIKAGL